MAIDDQFCYVYIQLPGAVVPAMSQHEKLLHSKLRYQWHLLTFSATSGILKLEVPYAKYEHFTA